MWKSSITASDSDISSYEKKHELSECTIMIMTMLKSNVVYYQAKSLAGKFDNILKLVVPHIDQSELDG